MAEIRELEENQKACENQEPLTKEEEEKIQAVRDQLGTDFCRRCNYCAPCSVGIQIPSVFCLPVICNVMIWSSGPEIDTVH